MALKISNPGNFIIVKDDAGKPVFSAPANRTFYNPISDTNIELIGDAPMGVPKQRVEIVLADLTDVDGNVIAGGALEWIHQNAGKSSAGGSALQTETVQGGTAGQILAKASNDDLDFEFVTLSPSDILVDEEPTPGSPNAVKSGGTYKSLQNSADFVERVRTDIDHAIHISAKFILGNSVQNSGSRNIFLYPFDKDRKYELSIFIDNGAIDTAGLFDESQNLINSVELQASGQLTDLDFTALIKSWYDIESGVYLGFTSRENDTTATSIILKKYGTKYDFKTDTLFETKSDKSVIDLDRNIFQFVANRIGIIAVDGSKPGTSAEYAHSALLPCIEGIEFFYGKYRKSWDNHAKLFFYDVNKQPISGLVAIIKTGNDDNRYEATQSVKSPEGTRYFSYVTIGSGANVDQQWERDNKVFQITCDLKSIAYYNDTLLPAMTENLINVKGDSLGQGIGNNINDSLNDLLLIQKSVGGENVLDTCWRAGAISFKVKSLTNLPIVLPANGNAINVDAFFDYKTKYVFDASGNYTVDAPRRTNLNLNSLPVTIDGVTLLFSSSNNSGASANSTFTLRLQTPQAQDLTIEKTIEVAQNIGLGNNGIGIIMMGTNAGFAGPPNHGGTSLATSEAARRLVNIQRRLSRMYISGKFVVWGYHFGERLTLADQGNITWKEYYRNLMKDEFGVRYLDMENYLLTEGVKDLRITGFTQSEIDTYVSLGYLAWRGGTAMFLLSEDGTHPRKIVYQAMGNYALRRLYNLGFLKELRQIPLVFISNVVLTLTNPTISVGGTSTSSLTFTNPNNQSNLFLYTTSNAAVATVSASGVVTGIAAGAATITATCRYGGASGSAVITVS